MVDAEPSEISNTSTISSMSFVPSSTAEGVGPAGAMTPSVSLSALALAVKDGVL